MNVFRLDLREERLGASRRGLGREFQVRHPMYDKKRFSVLVEFDACSSHETYVCGTQRAGRLIDRKKIMQV